MMAHSPTNPPLKSYNLVDKHKSHLYSLKRTYVLVEFRIDQNEGQSI